MQLQIQPRAATLTAVVLSLSVVFIAIVAKASPHTQASFVIQSSTSDTPSSIHRDRPTQSWTVHCLNISKRFEKTSSFCNQLLREEHRVGALPWEDGEEPINESYAGHFPISSWKQDDYHGETSMFYWFIPAINPKVKNPPLVIWLQGGPGSSSMIGLFFENGPIKVTEDMKLVRRPVSWADDYSMLFIDQPVGTGYSYVTRLQDNDGQDLTDKDDLDQIIKRLNKELQEDQQKEQEFFAQMTGMHFTSKSVADHEEKIKKHAPLYSMGYVKDQRGVAADLLNFLDQFYQRYPEQKKADLYITGESYAGKYVPAMAHAIMESNKDHQRGQGKKKDMSGDAAEFGPKVGRGLIPLKGIALGNSLTDPISQVQIHADHAYYLGLVTKAQATRMKELQDQSVDEAYRGRFLASNQARLEVFDVFRNATGGLNWYDIRKGSIPNDWSRMEAFMNLAHVKDALNVYGPRSAFLIEHDASKEEIQQIEEGRARTKYFKDPLVYETMIGDMMRSTAWMVSSLLDQGIKVLVYQGIFDFRDAVAGSTGWIEGLEWDGHQEFKDTEREVWMVNERLAGYVRCARGLSWITILGAGHLAPMDQGENSLVMIQSLVEGLRLQSESVENSFQRPLHVI